MSRDEFSGRLNNTAGGLVREPRRLPPARGAIFKRLAVFLVLVSFVVAAAIFLLRFWK